MALSSFGRNLLGLCKIKGTGGSTGLAETPRLFFKLTTKCMKKVNSMISLRSSTSPKFNQEQCLYLADKLKIAVQSSHSFLELTNERYSNFVSDEDMAPSLEIFKLLFALGKEVETFIQGCCTNTWIQSAIMLASVSEYISSLGFNLELCTMVFSASERIGTLPTLTDTDVANASKAEARIVKEKAKLDEVKLTEAVIALIQSSKSDSTERQLAIFLLERLRSSSKNLNIAVPISNQCSGSKILFKNLEQLEMLGKGAFGAVHKARWLGAEVAMKTFFDPTTSDFKQEVSILDGLRHPNIVSLLWYMTDLRKCYMIMELMNGDLHSLMGKRLEERGFCGSPFSNAEALHIMLQVAEGMLFLHEKKIVHRDLKSHNILVNCMKTKEGNSLYLHAKVADFGLSKTKENSVTYSDQTQNQGSSRWMAPETIRIGNDSGKTPMHTGIQDLKYPFKSDIYSFAMLCYEILTGNVPFPTLRPADVKAKVLDGGRPQIPDQCPDRLRRLIEACWSSEPSARPCFDHICAELRHLKCEHLMKSAWPFGHPCLEENKTETLSAVCTSSAGRASSTSSSSSSSPRCRGATGIDEALPMWMEAVTEYEELRFRKELTKCVTDTRPDRGSKEIWLEACDTVEEEARAFDISNFCCKEDLPLNSPDSPRMQDQIPWQLPPDERWIAITKLAIEAALEMIKWKPMELGQAIATVARLTVESFSSDVTQSCVMYSRGLLEEFLAKETNIFSDEARQPCHAWDNFELSHIFPADDLSGMETPLTDLFSTGDSRMQYNDDVSSGWGTHNFPVSKDRGTSYREELVKRLSKPRRPSSSKQIWIESYTRRRRQRASSARSSTSGILQSYKKNLVSNFPGPSTDADEYDSSSRKQLYELV